MFAYGGDLGVLVRCTEKINMQVQQAVSKANSMLAFKVQTFFKTCRGCVGFVGPHLKDCVQSGFCYLKIDKLTLVSLQLTYTAFILGMR